MTLERTKEKKEEAKYIDIQGKETEKIRQSKWGGGNKREKENDKREDRKYSCRERESVVVSMRVCVSFICWCNGSMMNGSQIKKKELTSRAEKPSSSWLQINTLLQSKEKKNSTYVRQKEKKKSTHQSGLVS